MPKLWIYGCSFSTDFTRSKLGIDGKLWYEYISEYFNLDLKNKARDGHGMLSVILNVIKTQSEWNKDDLIIIQIPDSQRIDIPALRDATNVYELSTDSGKLVDRMNTRLVELGVEHTDQHQIDIWNSFISLLKLHPNKNIYTWFIHHTTAFGEYANHYNSLYDGSVMDFINDKKLYISEDDKHFSPLGAKTFYNHILPKIKYNG